jgi:HK97 family phage major capsid protein
MPGPIDASGVIPPQIATEIIGVAGVQSGVLSLARTVPMPTGVTQMPVQTSVPSAAFVTGAGGRKPFTDLAFGMETMTAEEVAAVVAIPQAYLDDSSINLWNFIKPQLGSAISQAVDNAVLFGHNAPATWPTGGITAAAYCQDTPDGADALATVNDAMGLVEGQGLPVTGHSADLSVKSALRGVRDNNGALLLGPSQVASPGAADLYGVPVVFGQYPVDVETIDFVTGDWDALLIGVRQDIRYDIDSSGVIADASGKVLVSAFQDDTVLMRVYARYGCIVINPPTQKYPDGALPFASASLVDTGAARSSSSSSSSSAAKKATASR